VSHTRGKFWAKRVLVVTLDAVYLPITAAALVLVRCDADGNMAAVHPSAPVQCWSDERHIVAGSFAVAVLVLVSLLFPIWVALQTLSPPRIEEDRAAAPWYMSLWMRSFTSPKYAAGFQATEAVSFLVRLALVLCATFVQVG
jgi:hypothetical protein